MSFYQNDLRNDMILSRYLDGVYRQLELNVQRVTDLDLQHRGIDLLLKENGQTIKVDEKAQTHYLNLTLPTFAFEIGYLKNGQRHEGWLFDPLKFTQEYFLIVHIYTDGDTLTSPEGIKSCAMLRIQRQMLIAELAKLGIDSAACHRREAEARQGGLYGRIPVANENRFSFNRSQHLAESPFNIVIRLDMLATIGKWIYKG